MDDKGLREQVFDHCHSAWKLLLYSLQHMEHHLLSKHQHAHLYFETIEAYLLSEIRFQGILEAEVQYKEI